MATAGLLGMGLGTSSQADTAPTDPSDPASPPTVAADALPAPQINGVVWSQTVVGDTVYAAGSFTNARPAGSPAGVNTVLRSNLLAFSISTGQLLPWAPVTDGQVRSITRSPDGSKIYITGDFSRVDGVYHVRIAAFTTSNNAIIAGFKPTLASAGLAIAASDTTVFVGGNFQTVASTTGGTLVPRKYLAALNGTTGVLTSFVADANAPVTALAVTTDGQRVAVGGRFTNLSGSPFYGLGSVNPTTGAPVSFPANNYIRNAGDDSGITSLYADATGIYGTSYHFGGGGNSEGPFRIDATTGALIWVADCHGDSYSSFPVGGVVYVSSHEHYCGNMGGFPQTNPWTMYHATAFTKVATGINTPDIYGYPDHDGEPAPTLLNFYPTFTTGQFTGQGQAGWSVTGNDDYIVYGGEFPAVNGGAQQGLVRFAVSSKAPNKQGPMLSGANWTPTVSSHIKGQVHVAYRSNWDRDNETLTYRLYRGTEASTPLQVVTIKTPFWKPQLTAFTDMNAPAGTTQQYRVTATDPFNNVARSPWVSVNVNNSYVLSQYGAAVLQDGASAFWRLSEPSGTTVEDWAGGANAVAGTGVTRGAAGAIGADSNTASTFSGSSSGMAATQTTVPGPQVFSVEAWFKTTTTAGGKIVGFGDANTGLSNNYDRHIYMDTSGRVSFGVHPGASRIVTSPASYNDGAWHHVVGTLSPSGEKLFVDGRRVALRTDTTSAQPYSGYWRIGGDSSWSGAAYFNGSIDDVAIYPSALPAATINAHWVKSGRASTFPAAPADAYGAAVFGQSGDAPEVYWRLGESSGSTAASAGPWPSDGWYVGTVTKNVPGALASVANTAVSFSGSANNFVVSKASLSSPRVYTEELWFRTTTTNGGKLIGFGSANTGVSATYDRHVYMGTDGRLTFGVRTGASATTTITTPSAYNNGQWHHMVATQAADGMKLYVDGALRASNPQSGAQVYTGFWRVGGDTTWGPQPWFSGSIDEAAVYSTALPASVVLQHFQLGTNTVNNPPVAAFSLTPTNLSVHVDASTSSDDGSIVSYAWAFDDGATASGPVTDHTFTTAGNHAVTLTVTDDDGVTGTLTKTANLSAANVLPTASFTTSVGADGRTVGVNASASDDPDGTIASYAWTFGPSGTGTGVTSSYTFPADGTYTIGLTVTDNNGGTASTSAQVTVTAPAGPPVFGTDTFTRTSASGWGTADFGGTWGLTGSATLFTVQANAGRVSVGPGSTPRARLPIVQQDVDVTVNVTLDHLSDAGVARAFLAARTVGTNTDYYLNVRYATTGAVSVQLQRRIAGVETSLATVSLPGTVYVPGQKLNLRLQAQGVSPTTVRAKVWISGQPEPGAWQITATDSAPELQVPGGIGIGGYSPSATTNGPILFIWDDVTARGIA